MIELTQIQTLVFWTGPYDWPLLHLTVSCKTTDQNKQHNIICMYWAVAKHFL